MAQTGPTGVWQSDFNTDAGQKLSLQIVVNKLAGGGYGVTVYYMEQGAVKNLTATSVSFADGKLAFTVKDLGGSYAGTLENKTITGEWRQGANAVTMVLTPFKRSAHGGRDVEKLLGEWAGISTTPEGFVFRTVCRFEKTAAGNLAGFIDYPDAGVFNHQVTDMFVDGNQLRFGVPLLSAQFSGQLTKEGLDVHVAYPDGSTDDSTLIKGKKYPVPVIRLGMSGEDMEKLLGRWLARLGPVTIVFRFERNQGGEMAGFLDIPEQNVNGMRVYRASLVDGNLSLKSLGMDYTGTLSGNTISGTMKAVNQPNPFPVTATKE